MHHYRLVSTQNKLTLFEGKFYSYKTCLEQAVKDNIKLHDIDLRHKNLSNANLDGAYMARADFTGSNLTGANLTECALMNASFEGAALYSTYFCDSNLSACNFNNAAFGATDICGAIISGSCFSTLSCFTLDFGKTRQMSDCTFHNPDGKICRMNRPPIVINGLGNMPVILMDEYIKSGHALLDHKRIAPIMSRISERELTRRLGKMQKGAA